MKRIKFIVFAVTFLSLAHFGYGQVQKVDSLKNLLKTANDTTQVNLLRFMSVHSRSINKENAINFGIQSLEKSKEIGFVLGEIKAYYSLGVTHGMTDDYVESLSYLNQCLDLALKNKNFYFVHSSYNGMGIVYKRIGDYPNSQKYYLKGLHLNDSLGTTEGNSSIYMNLGVLYDLMNEDEKAKESYENAIKFYQGDNHIDNENKVNSNLGVLHLKNSDYHKALEKFLPLIDYFKSADDKSDLCIVYGNIGNCYLGLKQFDLAQDYLMKSLDIAEQMSLQQEINVGYQRIAKLKLEQGDYKAALEFSKLNLKTLNQMGQMAQKKEAHDQAYEIYEALGDYPKAIYHLQQEAAYRDSLLNETKVKEIQSLQIKHEVYIKDKELKENELQMALLSSNIEANNKRMVYLSIIVALLLLSAVLLFVGLRNKVKSNKELHEKTVLISKQKDLIGQMNLELEKRMLRAQMNPHFIFNSLSSIQHLISSDDKKGAMTYLTKFSKLLRQVLESSVNANLVLNEEIELLKIYVELESLRFDNSFSYAFEIDENLDIHQYEVPMLLVQPYIENAIIHGLLPKKGPKNLQISFKDQKEYIVCTIEDNGVGFQESSKKNVEKGPSRGMSITSKRINALEKFSNQELVTVENLKEGTKVTILIPKE
ncbi:MAG: tetratricopeptide repeat protein [Muricauda sp.]|nr:tetratricopeptide repeat protein [Allomuricauda sp.]